MSVSADIAHKPRLPNVQDAETGQHESLYSARMPMLV